MFKRYCVHTIMQINLGTPKLSGQVYWQSYEWKAPISYQDLFTSDSFHWIYLDVQRLLIHVSLLPLTISVTTLWFISSSILHFSF